MAKKSKSTRASKKPKSGKRRDPWVLREGGERVRVVNSGLEVWLYDDQNLAPIREAGAHNPGFGGMPGNFEALTADGLIVGYSLVQDDELDVGIYVGKPFTEKELSIGRWLEPQVAFLRLPSGRLCVESNDASRVGPESPNEKGAKIAVPPGDYRLTLLRIDHEALDREGLEWSGPHEIILLTPGGSHDDAASEILPFEPRRDLSWVGRYVVEGRSAKVLVWFGDYWDTFLVNLDRAAAEKLSLSPGSYLRTEVPAADLTLITAYGDSWDEAKRFPAPSGVDLAEYGYGAFCPMSDWNGAELLFCRRDTSKKRAEDRHQNSWLEGRVEVLAVERHVPQRDARGFGPTKLSDKRIFDPGFLALVLSDLLPEVGDEEELELQEAIEMIDEELAKLELRPQGDVEWTEKVRAQEFELAARLYTGLPHTFAAVLAGEGSFQLVFLSELDDGRWVVTGLADELSPMVERPGTNGLPEPHPMIAVENMDEAIEVIWKTHVKKLEKSKVKPSGSPRSLQQAIDVLNRFFALVRARGSPSARGATKR